MQQALKLKYQTKELGKDFVIESCNSIKPWLINIRRELHKIPELALEENLTKQKVISYLKKSELIIWNLQNTMELWHIF
ncbi:peptidase, M20D family domain protein [Clostridioides difficile CD133]|nr:peptidase, M20D family domain protein [Clostridioides difficile]EQF15239.1 peptidase, M20D family domain protein [Clostridioides difficile CD133]